MENNWIVQNLQNALETWNEKFAEIWQLISQSPETFKGGGIWGVMVDINGALQATGYALLVLFFVFGAMRSASSLQEIKRPEHAFRLFLRFALAKMAVTYGMELMTALFKICSGIMANIANSVGNVSDQTMTLPDVVVQKIGETGFWKSIPLWIVTLLGSLFITILAFIMILQVYGRFFRLYMYTAISPIPLATFAGEPTSGVGKAFLKSYAGVCLEGAIIILACVIFSHFAQAPPAIQEGLEASQIVWNYVAELIFNLLVLVGTIKMSERIVKEMLGL